MLRRPAVDIGPEEHENLRIEKHPIDKIKFS
jgi:hypothetical protein